MFFSSSFQKMYWTFPWGVLRLVDVEAEAPSAAALVLKHGVRTSPHAHRAHPAPTVATRCSYIQPPSGFRT